MNSSTFADSSITKFVARTNPLHIEVQLIQKILDKNKYGREICTYSIIVRNNKSLKRLARNNFVE